MGSNSLRDATVRADFQGQERSETRGQHIKQSEPYTPRTTAMRRADSASRDRDRYLRNEGSSN
jgi:hypothetical protein